MVDIHFDEETALELAHGVLPPGEGEVLLAHARECAACDRLLVAAAAERERFRARQDAVFASTPATVNAAEDVPTRRPGRNRMLGAAAAAILFGVAATLLLRNPFVSPPDPHVLGLPERPDLVRLRSSTEEADLTRLEEAIARYEQGDFARSARILATPFATARFESLRHLYRASALLALGRDDAARAVLDSTGTTPLPEAYEDWRAWARFHVSDAPEAEAQRDSVVRALAAREGPLQAKAQAVLDATTEPPTNLP